MENIKLSGTEKVRLRPLTTDSEYVEASLATDIYPDGIIGISETAKGGKRALEALADNLEGLSRLIRHHACNLRTPNAD